MNKFEKTHEELKRQLASIGIYDSDCPAEVFVSVNNKIPIQEENTTSVLQKQEEQKVDVNVAAS